MLKRNCFDFNHSNIVQNILQYSTVTNTTFELYEKVLIGNHYIDLISSDRFSASTLSFKRMFQTSGDILT